MLVVKVQLIAYQECENAKRRISTKIVNHVSKCVNLRDATSFGRCLCQISEVVPSRGPLTHITIKYEITVFVCSYLNG